MYALQQTQSDEIIDRLLGKHKLLNDRLGFAIGDFRIQVRSNSISLLEKLAAYFSAFASATERAGIELIAIETQAPELPLNFIDWQREPGKTGRKDSYADMAYCRLLRKVRTGMVFLQSADLRVASGPCLANINQVINFINAQYMNWLQQHDWLICHAAALGYQNRAYAFAGFSGGGKSTLMLKLLDIANTAFLSNDRLFIRRDADKLIAAGIAKLPRVNPGTIVNNPKLHGLMSVQQRQHFLAMPSEQLWQIEQKYDVDIRKIYGPQRIINTAPLDGLFILNWRHDSTEPLTVKQVQIEARQDLLGAVMKSPGPFYQYSNGRFYQGKTALPKQAYWELLRDITVYEVRGRTDFEKLAAKCRDIICA